MTDLYLVVQWLHVLSATVLFGTGIGIAFFLWAAHLGGDVATIAGVSRLVVRADWIFTATAGIVQPLSGAVLIGLGGWDPHEDRSEEHTSELQSLMRISYAVFC